jgi:WD40 repeat protein
VETGNLRDPMQGGSARSTVFERGLSSEAQRVFESIRRRASSADRGTKPTALAISPDRKTLASGADSGTVKLWDVATGMELLTLDGRTDTVWLLRFSPDGMTLAACARAPGERSVLLLWRSMGNQSAPETVRGAPTPMR